MVEQISPESSKKPIEIIIINPRNPNYEGVGIGVEITIPGFEGLKLDHHGPEHNSESPSAIEQAMDKDLETIKSYLDGRQKNSNY